MTDHRARAIARCAIAGLAACLFLLAACSSTSPAGGAATAPSAGGAVAGNPATGNDGSSCGNPAGGTVGAVGGAYASVLGAVLCGMPNIDPCSMLKPADVQALFSVPLASPTTDHLGNCNWPLSDPSKGDGLDIVVNVGEGEGPLDDDMGLSDLTPISGIGDHASWGLLAGYFPHLGAVKGQNTCELTIGGGDGQVSAPSTGKDVFVKIDDAALPGFMQQFGALCNQVFAGLGG